MKRIKKKNIILFVSIALIVLVFAAILLFKQYSNQPKKMEVITYEGFTFEEHGDMWFTEWLRQDNQSFVIPFHFNPKQVEDVPMEGRISQDFEKDAIYLTFDPDEFNLNYVAVAFGEISFSLVQVFNITPIASCTKNYTGCEDRPIVTCDDMDKAIIYVKQSNTTQVLLKGNCIVIEGYGSDIVKAADRLLFGMYNIMKR